MMSYDSYMIKKMTGRQDWQIQITIINKESGYYLASLK